MMTTTTLTIGDDLEVYRFGFGAMRITGDGIWESPPTKPPAAICCGGSCRPT